jgi:cell division protein FtsW (lipid II flippase)
MDKIIGVLIGIVIIGIACAILPDENAYRPNLFLVYFSPILFLIGIIVVIKSLSNKK